MDFFFHEPRIRILENADGSLTIQELRPCEYDQPEEWITLDSSTSENFIAHRALKLLTRKYANNQESFIR